MNWMRQQQQQSDSGASTSNSTSSSSSQPSSTPSSETADDKTASSSSVHSPGSVSSPGKIDFDLTNLSTPGTPFSLRSLLSPHMPASSDHGDLDDKWLDLSWPESDRGSVGSNSQSPTAESHRMSSPTKHHPQLVSSTEPTAVDNKVDTGRHRNRVNNMDVAMDTQGTDLSKNSHVPVGSESSYPMTNHEAPRPMKWRDVTSNNAIRHATMHHQAADPYGSDLHRKLERMELLPEGYTGKLKAHHAAAGAAVTATHGQLINSMPFPFKRDREDECYPQSTTTGYGGEPANKGQHQMPMQVFCNPSSHHMNPMEQAKTIFRNPWLSNTFRQVTPSGGSIMMDGVQVSPPTADLSQLGVPPHMHNFMHAGIPDSHMMAASKFSGRSINRMPFNSGAIYDADMPLDTYRQFPYHLHGGATNDPRMHMAFVSRPPGYAENNDTPRMRRASESNLALNTPVCHAWRGAVPLPRSSTLHLPDSRSINGRSRSSSDLLESDMTPQDMSVDQQTCSQDVVSKWNKPLSSTAISQSSSAGGDTGSHRSLEREYPGETKVGKYSDNAMQSCTLTSTQPDLSIAPKTEDSHICQVCNDVAAGFHCGAYVCEACKVSITLASVLAQVPPCSTAHTSLSLSTLKYLLVPQHIPLSLHAQVPPCSTAHSSLSLHAQVPPCSTAHTSLSMLKYLLVPQHIPLSLHAQVPPCSTAHSSLSTLKYLLVPQHIALSMLKYLLVPQHIPLSLHAQVPPCSTAHTSLSPRSGTSLFHST